MLKGKRRQQSSLLTSCMRHCAPPPSPCYKKRGQAAHNPLPLPPFIMERVGPLGGSAWGRVVIEEQPLPLPFHSLRSGGRGGHGHVCWPPLPDEEAGVVLIPTDHSHDQHHHPSPSYRNPPPLLLSFPSAPLASSTPHDARGKRRPEKTTKKKRDK